MSNAAMLTTALGFKFGLDKDLIADRLECLANGIRAGKILPQGSSGSVANTNNGFELTTFSVTYAEKVTEG